MLHINKTHVTVHFNVYINKRNFYYFTETIFVTNRHHSFTMEAVGVYWPSENLFTIMDSKSNKNDYYQVSKDEFLGKFRGKWQTGHILYTAGK